MRAILLATGEIDALRPLVERKPAHLFPLLNKHFLEYVVEYAVNLGVTEIHLILSHLPERSEEAVGDGSRWGCRIEHHLVPDEKRAWPLLRLLARRWGEEMVLLGRADALPAFTVEELSEPGCLLWLDPSEGDAPGTRIWSGWASLPAALLRRMPPNIEAEGPCLEFLRGARPVGFREHVVGRHMDLRTWEGYLRAQELLLRGHFEGLVLPGREVEPGVRICRNVSLHPSAKIEPPVYFGWDSRVEAGARVGPCAAIQSGSIVDEDTIVRDSSLWPGTYVGQGLELSSMIADRGWLVAVSLGTVLPPRESFLIGNLADRPHLRRPRGLLRRVGAAALLLLHLPLLLVVGLVLAIARRGPVLARRRVVRLPAYPDPTTWKRVELRSFGAGMKPVELRSALERLLVRTGLDRLPGLFEVALGRISLVGVTPRSARELEELDAEWRAICLEGRVGLMGPWELECGPDATREQRFAFEAFHAAASSARSDLRVFLRWLLSAKPDADPFAGEGGRPAAPEPGEEAPEAEGPLPRSEREVVDRAELMRLFEGDLEILGEVSELFLGTCDEQMSAVERAVASASPEAVRSAAHAIKGSVAQFRAGPAVEAAAALEEAARGETLEGAGELARDLAGEVERLKLALTSLSPGG